MLVAFGFVALATLRWDEWVGAAAIQTTNDAYIKADMTRLSSRVAGEVLTVAVNDFQRVKAGDLLVQIDPADYEAQVAQAEAGVAAAQAAFDNLANQVELQYATIAQAEAQQVSAQAQEVETREEQERQQSLTQTEAGTRQKLEQAIAGLRPRAGRCAGEPGRDRGRAPSARSAGRHQEAARGGSRGAKAALAAAKLKLGYTRIVAPFDGVVGEREVQPSDYVNIGSNLIDVVPLPNVYVIANYKETQLTRVKPGQPVDVTVDTFLGREAARPRRADRAGQRLAIRAAAARQCDRQFHQGGAAHPGPDRSSTRASRCWSACCRACRWSPEFTPTRPGPDGGK